MNSRDSDSLSLVFTGARFRNCYCYSVYLGTRFDLLRLLQWYHCWRRLNREDRILHEDVVGFADIGEQPRVRVREVDYACRE